MFEWRTSIHQHHQPHTFMLCTSSVLVVVFFRFFFFFFFCSQHINRNNTSSSINKAERTKERKSVVIIFWIFLPCVYWPFYSDWLLVHRHLVCVLYNRCCLVVGWLLVGGWWAASVILIHEWMWSIFRPIIHGSYSRSCWCLSFSPLVSACHWCVLWLCCAAIPVCCLCFTFPI